MRSLTSAGMWHTSEIGPSFCGGGGGQGLSSPKLQCRPSAIPSGHSQVLCLRDDEPSLLPRGGALPTGGTGGSWLTLQRLRADLEPGGTCRTISGLQDLALSASGSLCQQGKETEVSWASGHLDS